MPAGCSDSVTQYTYDATGQVRTITDSNHNTTSLSYADSPTGANAAGESNAYLTQVSTPQVNGVSHAKNYTYDYTRSNLISAEDENSPDFYLYLRPEH